MVRVVRARPASSAGREASLPRVSRRPKRGSAKHLELTWTRSSSELINPAAHGVRETLVARTNLPRVLALLRSVCALPNVLKNSTLCVIKHRRSKDRVQKNRLTWYLPLFESGTRILGA